MRGPAAAGGPGPAIGGSVRRARTAILERIRRNGRPVAWTPGFMGFGNVLLLALWAFQGQRSGSPRWIRHAPALDGWTSVFPGLGQVVLTDREIRFADARVMPWSESSRAAGVEGTVASHEPLDLELVDAFLAEILIPGSEYDAGIRGADRSRTETDPDQLVVNVRRGDYYAVPEIRAQYGFDQEAYLRIAVAGSVAADGPPSRIVVISDGIDWCREHLGWLAEVAPTEFSDRPADPMADFRAVATSRRAVITNSTFSYWACLVSTSIWGGNHASIWAPRFFDRTQNGGRSWLVDERWSIVEEIPGGWDHDPGAGE